MEDILLSTVNPHRTGSAWLHLHKCQTDSLSQHSIVESRTEQREKLGIIIDQWSHCIFMYIQKNAVCTETSLREKKILVLSILTTIKQNVMRLQNTPAPLTLRMLQKEGGAERF